MSKCIIILCGIPTAGKTTWTKNFLRKNIDAASVSRDEIRDRIYGKDYWKRQKEKLNYAYSKTANEKYVTTLFDRQVKFLMGESYINTVILDNTHCKESYLIQAIDKYEKEGYSVEIEFFDISIAKAYYRNVIRYFKTGKWIPLSVIKNMKSNYDKIDQTKYEKYVVL